MDEIDVQGLRVGYERAGSGPSLVLVHGFVGDGRSTWSSQLEALSDEFTVVAWDAPGAGRSSDPPQWFRLSDYADCLSGFVGALGLVRPHLIGLSFGAALVLEVFRRHPAVPQTMVLASAYAGWAGSLDPEAVADRLRVSLHNADLAPELFEQAMISSMFGPSAAEQAVARFGRQPACVQPRRLSVHGAFVGRGRPSRRAAEGQRAHAAALRRPGCPRTLEGRQRLALSHPRLTVGDHPRRRACQPGSKHQNASTGRYVPSCGRPPEMGDRHPRDRGSAIGRTPQHPWPE
jgi:pimeloyl-ACP methyl ester carboxylesterase